MLHNEWKMQDFESRLNFNNPWHATRAIGGNGNVNVMVYAQHGNIVGVYRKHSLNWLPEGDTSVGKWQNNTDHKEQNDRNKHAFFEFNKTPPLMAEALLKHKINGTRVDSLVSELKADFEDDAIAQLLTDFQIKHDIVPTEDVNAEVLAPEVCKDKDNVIEALSKQVCDLEKALEFTGSEAEAVLCERLATAEEAVRTKDKELAECMKRSATTEAGLRAELTEAQEQAQKDRTASEQLMQLLATKLSLDLK